MMITNRLLPSVFATRSRTALFAKRASHQLNIAFALVKSEERESFAHLSSKPVTALQGIGPKHAAELETLGIETIEQLATYKFFHLARAIDTLGATEEPNGRLEDTILNIDNGVDKAYEHMYLKDILDAPVSALQGISEEKGSVWKQLGCKTVQDLANYKYARWAEAILTAAEFEQQAN
mmetsp:Transcript_22163/g.46765  ORF Transcript_22163/g.46765 Transcript_22163/m.46765 type:complete len:179 (+) Transcript_22163:3-539(+)